MGPVTALIAFCACIVAASLAGGVVPVLVRLSHRRLQFGLSFVSGVMLGVAESVITAGFGSTWTQMLSFALVIVALAWRPHGLFGRAAVKKV